MKDVLYDMSKLKELDEFEPKFVEERYSDQREYFAQLTSFIEKSGNYLSSYNPTVVIFGDEVREEFLAELFKIKAEVTSLGIKQAAMELPTLEDAVGNRNEKALSDGLVKFYAKTEILINQIKTAQLANSSGESGKDSQNKPLIMTVDDSTFILNVIKDMLEDEYKVIALTNGEEALKATNTHVPELFLLDIEMPVMDGHTLVKKIKEIEKLKDTPILFLSSNAQRKHVFTAMEQGVRDYILKPVEKNVLLQKIKENIVK